MREQGIETVRASAPVDLCKSFFRRLGKTSLSPNVER